MSAHSKSHGVLYLVPTPLDFGIAQDTPALAGQWLPAETLTAASRLTHWITENAKSTRAFLKRVETVAGLAAPLQAQHIVELPRTAHKKGDHAPQADNDAQARELLAPALLGHDMGLVSEAGMPAIADPGSSIVRAAHAMGLRVVPLTGPISLMLALAASGLNGQGFAFVGYVPQEASERAKRLRELESVALKNRADADVHRNALPQHRVAASPAADAAPAHTAGRVRCAHAAAASVPQRAGERMETGQAPAGQPAAGRTQRVSAGPVNDEAAQTARRLRWARTEPLSSALARARSIVASRKPSLLPQS